MSPRLRAWSELYTPRQCMEPRVMDLLERHHIHLCLAVWKTTPDLGEMLRAYQERDLPVTLWPLLTVEEGYWPNTQNLEPFEALVERLLAFARREKAMPRGIAIDLETPMTQVLALKHAGPLLLPRLLRIGLQNLNPQRHRQSGEHLRRLTAKLHGEGLETLVAVIPPVVDDTADGREALQDSLETPVTQADWDTVHLMLYTSPLIGYSQGWFTPQDGAAGIHSYARDARRIWGNRAGVSLGLTGRTGLLGHEPLYPGPPALALDVSAARAAGIHDLAIYNLEGIAQSATPDAWFEAMARTPPRRPPPSTKVALLRAGIQAWDRGLGMVFR